MGLRASSYDLSARQLGSSAVNLAAGLAAIILVSFFGLLQFKLLFNTLAILASDRKGGVVWKKVQPLLSDLVGSLEASLGPASKFTPSLTHILLVRPPPLPACRLGSCTEYC